jgi:predicted Zn-dependent protease
MPRPSPAGLRICFNALLRVSICFAAVAQGTGDGAPNPNEAEFQTLLKQGFDLHRQARFTEAIPMLERARRLEPQDYFANLLLGIDLLRIGKASEAVPHLKLAASARPQEEPPEDYIGEAQASLGHYAQAAEAYHRAIQRGHDSEEALEAWAGFALERFRQVGEDLRASSSGVSTVRRLADAAAKPESALVCAESIPVLERKLALQPGAHALAADHMETAYKLSICYAVEAGRAAERLQANAQDDAALHRLRGDVLLRLKTDAAAAEGEYRKAIALRPGDPALLERLAEAQLTAGDTEGARQSAQAALAVDPHRREALRTLTTIDMSNRDYDQALPWLRQLAAESPNDRTAQVELGRALAQTGNSSEALRYLAPALDSGYPDEKGALHALEARALHDLGREHEASKASAEARRLSDSFQARSRNDSNEKLHADQ